MQLKINDRNRRQSKTAVDFKVLIVCISAPAAYELALEAVLYKSGAVCVFHFGVLERYVYRDNAFGIFIGERQRIPAFVYGRGVYVMFLYPADG